MDSKNQGFTLLEVIVSLGLMVMIFGLLPLVTVIQNSNTYSANSNSMTNLAMELSEELSMRDFAVLGTDTYADCKMVSDGHVQNGTRLGICIEGPMNALGYTNLENSTDTNYYFYRYSVVCTNTWTLPGGYTGDPCFLPFAQRVSPGPVPTELECYASNYSNSMKEIKVLAFYTDKKGKCKYTSLRSLKTIY